MSDSSVTGETADSRCCRRAPSTRLITCLLPAFNAQQYIREAIDSILGQSYREFELLVIDDGSSDATPEILESIKDSRVRVVRNPANMGISRTLNRGIGLASGEFIARMDSDDIAFPGRFERQLACFQEDSDLDYVATAIQSFTDVRTWRYHSGFTTDAELKVGIFYQCCISHPSVMVRRRAFVAARGYDPLYDNAEDYELWCRMFPVAKGLNLREVYLKYRVHPQQISSARKARQVQVDQAIKRRSLGFLMPEGNELDMRCYLSVAHGRLCFGVSLGDVVSFARRLCEVNAERSIYPVKAFEDMTNAKVAHLNDVATQGVGGGNG